MNQSFRLPKSAAVPNSFNEQREPTSRPPSLQYSKTPSTPAPTSTTHLKQKSKFELLQQAKASFPAGRGYRNHHTPSYSHQKQPQELPRGENTIPMDYHLRMPTVTDNPKKLSKFQYIRVIPRGDEYAVYIQNNHISFYGKRSSSSSAVISHKTDINRTMFMCTMVRSGFFVITDIFFYKGVLLSTHEERLTALLEVLTKQVLLDINTSTTTATNSITDPSFDAISFHPTHLFSQWNDFVKGSLHIPYEIKHLEYCVHAENLNKQTNRFIYILNKKNLKRSPISTDLVYTSSREFRVDIVENTGPKEDFKTCVLMGKPFMNIVGYGHLDKQEESDEE
jgi:hypothetical protein